jgi:hypothetical protein
MKSYGSKAKQGKSNQTKEDFVRIQNLRRIENKYVKCEKRFEV